MVNAADPKAVEEQKKDAKFRRSRELSDLKAVLSTPQGQRTIWRYLAMCGVYRLSYTGNADTNFNEGQRSIGLNMISDLNEADPKLYLQMAELAKSEEQNA